MDSNKSGIGPVHEGSRAPEAAVLRIQGVARHEGAVRTSALDVLKMLQQADAAAMAELRRQQTPAINFDEMAGQMGTRAVAAEAAAEDNETRIRNRLAEIYRNA